MQSWITELKQLGPPDIVLAVAGNKVDIEVARQARLLVFVLFRIGGCYNYTLKTVCT